MSAESDGKNRSDERFLPLFQDKLRAGALQRGNIVCLQALFSLAYVKRYLLTVLQGAAACTIDSAEMDKDIGTAFLL